MKKLLKRIWTSIRSALEWIVSPQAKEVLDQAIDIFALILNVWTRLDKSGFKSAVPDSRRATEKTRVVAEFYKNATVKELEALLIQKKAGTFAKLNADDVKKIALAVDQGTKNV